MGSKKAILVIGTVVIFAIIATVLYYTTFLPSKGEWTFTLVVNGKTLKTYKLNELTGLAEKVNITRYGTVKAVPLLKLLEKCNIDLNKFLVYSIKAVGADGYTRTIKIGEYGIDNEAYLYVPKTYIYIVEERYVAKSGPLRLVVENLGEKYWVKYLVKIELETKPWSLSIMKDGITVKSYSLDELKQKQKHSYEYNGEVVQVISLELLLSEAGVDPQSVKCFDVYASDGYKRVIGKEYLSKTYILMIGEDEIPKKGPLCAIIDGLSRKYWVHHLVAINLVTKK